MVVAYQDVRLPVHVCVDVLCVCMVTCMLVSFSCLAHLAHAVSLEMLI